MNQQLHAPNKRINSNDIDHKKTTSVMIVVFLLFFLKKLFL